MVGNEWDATAFAKVRKQIAGYDYQVNSSAIEMAPLHEFLSSHRDFMLRLLENPVLLEHESFTDLLRAVFHLTEELKRREDFSCLPETDCAHISGDVRRVYEKLIMQNIRRSTSPGRDRVEPYLSRGPVSVGHLAITGT